MQQVRKEWQLCKIMQHQLRKKISHEDTERTEDQDEKILITQPILQTQSTEKYFKVGILINSEQTEFLNDAELPITILEKVER